VGKGNQDTTVQVQQNNQQTQDLSVANTTLADTLKSLTDVLNTQAANPTPVLPITIVANTPSAATPAPQYSNPDVNALTQLMYYNILSGQQNAQNTTDASPPDTLTTIFITAAIVVIAIMISRR
jgi:hypothetical protein